MTLPETFGFLGAMDQKQVSKLSDILDLVYFHGKLGRGFGGGLVI